MDQMPPPPPPPADPPVVTLEIRAGSAAGPGWNTIYACDNDYAYTYQGGSDGHGNVIMRARGAVNVTVRLLTDVRYAIENVIIDNDPKQQLSVADKSPRVATILDKNDALMDNAYYALKVQDTEANCRLIFDPYISNTN